MAEQNVEQSNSHQSGIDEERQSEQGDYQTEKSDYIRLADSAHAHESLLDSNKDTLSTTGDDATRRLNRLEAQNRRTQLMLLVAYGLLGYTIFLLVFVGQPVQEQTSSVPKEIKLVDAAGVPRMYLRIYSGKPVLQVLDSQGTSRLSLGMRFDDTPFIDFSDQSGRTRGSFSMAADGKPTVNVFEEDGKSSFTLN